jgi:hypothetical protein
MRFFTYCFLNNNSVHCFLFILLRILMVFNNNKKRQGILLLVAYNNTCYSKNVSVSCT